ncbi:DUF45 domain-containing protein [Anabaena azotica FACHB-119]|uniref:DUF45 domain-containing protein n=1 Tax=Anabaena azotica FACHB-119 TaxID=947527 RepID=A0ABR8DBK2_9NOST|nr:DUF45 domain-containing protein [Anabaena azotica FACHB-119]
MVAHEIVHLLHHNHGDRSGRPCHASCLKWRGRKGQLESWEGQI